MERLVDDIIPQKIPNWINGKEQHSFQNQWLEKFNPSTGELLCSLVRSEKQDIDEAVTAAKTSQSIWGQTPPVQRGMVLHEIVQKLIAHQTEIAQIVSQETGKSPKEALGETMGAIQLGLFYASEGQRLYGRTTTSGALNKQAMTIRQPLGVAGLIIAANTPIANVAWKVFPALICGNSVVLKAAEDTPATAWIFGKLTHETGLPEGILNIIQGLGNEAGEALVAHPGVDVVSFTGSSKVGQHIAQIAAKRLLRVSLELGGKNPLVVCDDADIDNAIKWTLLSAFSNAGQRCASASRIIIFESIYESFKQKLIAATQKFKVGPTDNDDFGPVINEKQLQNMIQAVNKATADGALILYGGNRLKSPDHANGYYMMPTLLENAHPNASISKTELFGPIACLYPVKNFEDAIDLANHSPYGLTASIHTKSFHRSQEFIQKIQSGVAVVNAGTYGSEPHMPFGGLKQSGNGSREPGTEALDIYSNLKDVYLIHDPNLI